MSYPQPYEINIIVKMIKIKVGESVPQAERVTDAGLSIRLPKGSAPEGAPCNISFKIKFQNHPGTDYEAEAKSIETSIKSLLKLSKSLNYTARHIIDEFDVASRVVKEGEDAFFVLDVLTTDPKHYERILKIIDGLKDKHNDEHIEIRVETNFNHFFKLSPDGKHTKLLYNISTELHQGTKDAVQGALKDLPDFNSMLGMPQLIYLLSLKKLTVEADVDFDLYSILPKEDQPGFILDLASPMMKNSDSKFPLSTSMKKIGIILRDKMESNFELTAQVGLLSCRLWVKFHDLYERIIKDWVEV
jgi:hypothetical protein